MEGLVTVCGLLLLTLSVHAHVVPNFEKECKEYFYKNFVPQWKKTHVHICQVFENKYYFATLYDTDNRIPVYSAYIFEPSNDSGREKRWFVEPQLVDDSWEKSMMTDEELMNEHHIDLNRTKEKQAVDKDYVGLKEEKGYDRGHLNPNGHHAGLGRNATFTLTNVVPQLSKLNGGEWNKYENELKEIFKGCAKAYVLVGAIPSSNNWVKDNRVNIPDTLWHAYCCVDQNNKPYKSGAATAKNNENKVMKHKLDELEKLLKDYVDKLFSENCSVKSGK